MLELSKIIFVPVKIAFCSAKYFLFSVLCFFNFAFYIWFVMEINRVTFLLDKSHHFASQRVRINEH